MKTNETVAPRAALAKMIGSKQFDSAVSGLILFNAILLGLETNDAVAARYGGLIETINALILGIFVVELLLRMAVFGRRYWSSGWNWFDVTVIGIALAPATAGFDALRALRAIRLFRLITVVPSLRRVVEGLLEALPGLGSIIVLLSLLLYVFSVMATNLFGVSNPDLFGSLSLSAFSLFTVMTLEGWPDVARAVMAHHDWAWAFFLVFILASSFSVLNLFIGIIVDAMRTKSEAVLVPKSEVNTSNSDTLVKEIAYLREEVSALRRSLAGHM